jgi:hypothetical protein
VAALSVTFYQVKNLKFIGILLTAASRFGIVGTGKLKTLKKLSPALFNGFRVVLETLVKSFYLFGVNTV